MNQINLILQRSIAQANNRINLTLKRLATGMRINSPADDPAGLALSTNLNTQIRALAQAKQNTQSGINMLNIGVTSLQNMESILQQLKELTQKAASGSYTGAQRQQMQKQANDLLKSLYDTKNSTSFGGIDIFGSNSTTSSTSVASPTSYASYAASTYKRTSSVGSATNDGSSYTNYAIPSSTAAPMASTASTKAAGPGGTNPEVHITSAQQFIDLISQDGTDTAGKTYILDNDIDFSGITYTSKTNFAGTLDGNGHSIKNFTGTNGLFASTDGATIKNLKLNVTITGTSANAGGLIGNATGTRVEGVTVSGSITQDNNSGSLGGLIGLASSTTVVDSVSLVDVTSNMLEASGETYTGGLIGRLTNNGSVENSSSNGNITTNYKNLTSYSTASFYTGGLIGSAGSGGSANNSSFTGNITISDDAGSYSSYYTGGLIGRADYFAVGNSYATGGISVNSNSSSSSSGGLIGYSSSLHVTNSYSYGKVNHTGVGYIGAFIGSATNGSLMIEGSFYNLSVNGGMNAIGDTSSTGVSGLSASQFSSAEPFTNAGWDTSIWTFGVGDKPILTSQGIHITSAQEFIDLISQDGTNTAGKTYILDNDIDFSGITYTSKSGFAGTLIGNGHTIRNLTGSNGLFLSTTSTATIKDLNLDNIRMDDVSGVGALVGFNEGRIENIHVTNSNLDGGAIVGGLVGSNESTGVIISSSAQATVGGLGKTGNNSGGLVGENKGSIESSYAIGTVTGVKSVGGLVGDNSGTISKSYSIGGSVFVSSSSSNTDIGGLVGTNSGNISSSYSTNNVNTSITTNVGGLVGLHSGGSITTSYATGTVSGQNSVGGFVGSSVADISNSYSTGDVIVNSSTSNYVGGFVGIHQYAEISNCYTTGDVTAPRASYKGSFGGSNNYGQVNNCFWNSDTSSLNSAGYGGGSGITSAQFATSTPFTNVGWSNDVWTFGVGDRPMLAFEEIHITSAQEFIDFISQDGVGTSGKTYVLDNDIDFSGISYTSKTSFAGTLIGNGHTIRNLTGSNGLFLSTNSTATIKDLNLDNISMDNVSVVGALVGFNSGRIENVHVTNSNLDGGHTVGGLVGNNESTGVIISSSARATVGGLGKTVNNAGGLVGSNSGSIESSYSSGSVSSNENNAGGLVGSNSGSIESSYSSMEVSGSENTGGLVGSNNMGTISSSYATGSVDGTNSVGGLVGNNYMGVLEDTYASGYVHGFSETGGLVGRNLIEMGNGNITNSFWNRQTSGMSNGIGTSGYDSYATGLTTSQFSSASPFTNAGWSTSVWNFTVDGPHLIWENYSPATNEFHIKSAQEFIDIIGDGTNTAGKTYILDNDIDFSGITNYNSISNFEGTLDGNGHTIRNLTGSNGLFLSTNSTATIKDLNLDNISMNDVSVVGALVGFNSGRIENVHVTNSNLDGGHTVGGLVGNNESTGVIISSSAQATVGGLGQTVNNSGGLVGSNSGSIESSYSSGSVSSNKNNAGGLVGYNSGSISASYSDASVILGSSNGGGLIGYMNGGSVTDSYSTGFVNGFSSRVTNLGGFVGNFNSGTIDKSYSTSTGSSGVNGFAGRVDRVTITNSFWSSEISGLSQSSISGLTDLSKKEFSNAQNFISKGWSTSIWDFNEDRPHLKYENYRPSTSGGSGVGQITAEEAERLGYILIWNVDDFMNKIASDGSNTAGKTFILMNDINMSSLTNYAYKHNFAGTFEGNGYTIKNFTSSSGLFGTTTDTSEIKNLNLENFNINEAGGVGALVNINSGKIDNVTITSSQLISSTSSRGVAGGLVGINEVSGSITNSHADVLIRKGNALGALVGDNQGLISNSSSSGTIEGTSYLGGLAGQNSGTVENSSSTATITATSDYVGGLVGQNNSGTVANSHFSGDVSGNNTVGGLVGDNGGVVENSYSSGTVSGNSNVGGLVGYNTNTVSNSHSLSAVNGNSNVGGLVGMGSKGSVLSSYASGTVIGTGDYIGGLVGYQGSDIISDSYATGRVEGKDYVGGLVGENTGTVENSYSSGNVSGNNNVGGLVGYNSYGSISGSHYEGSTVTATGDSVGGLVGKNENGDIINSYANATVSGKNSVGGLIGYNSGTVNNSYSTGSASGGSSVGGLVGHNNTTGKINNSYSYASVTSTNTAGGGLVGNNNGNITNSFATGAVTGIYGVGGFVGSNTGTISSSYSTGNVSGKTYVGGFAGYLPSGSIINSYSIGNVTGLSGGSGKVGGFVGYLGGSIENVYSFGKVNSTLADTGGFVGTIVSGGTIKNSFWNTETAGISQAAGSGTVSGLTGLSTSGFLNMNTFLDAGWNTLIWNLNNGNPRPHLIFENYLAPGVEPGDGGDPDFDGYPDPPDGGGSSGGGSGSYPSDPGNNEAKTEVILQIGPDSSSSSQLKVDTSLDLDSIWINLSNSNNATLSLDSINKAIESITSKIESFGTTIDILDSIIDSNEVMSENLEAAKSTIMSADIAAETIELMKSKQQLELSQTMLTQVNNMQYEQAMNLIEGLNLTTPKADSSGREHQKILNQIQNNNIQHQKSLSSIQSSGSVQQQILNSIQDNNIYHQEILDIIQENNIKNSQALRIIKKYKQ